MAREDHAGLLVSSLNLPLLQAEAARQSGGVPESQRGREAEWQRGREAERQRGGVAERQEAERQRGREAERRSGREARGREAERQRGRELRSVAHRRCARVCLRLHPVTGKFPDGSEPDSDERAQNEDIMKQTSPAEPQPEPEQEPEAELEAEDGTRRLLVLCFILAVAYLASVGELEPLWVKVQPHLEPLLKVVVRNAPPEESGSDE